MTEAEWLACADPEPMLESLCGRASARKLRLFSLGCYERVAKHVRDDRSRAAVAFAWRHAEVGVARRRGRPAVLDGASRAWVEADDTILRSRNGRDYSKAEAKCCAADVARYTLHADAWYAARHCSLAACMTAGYSSGAARHRGGIPASYERAYDAESAQLAELLRDIFGNPFRPPKADPAWLAWSGGAVKGLAQMIYDDRTFDRLLILADALEEAGCTVEAILSHCRGGSEHVRGCWVVDLLTGQG